ncbi:hypothetical protein [Streptomyces sp. NRRL S-920]|uniref:hypothetical protein n=1 Tax=Streptomyces sp. NRRL S-920 TaxID=1463921 RepID=UPI0004CAA88F|nr:hypothetical protein [Streptomyces sp. NRRL S-920]
MRVRSTILAAALTVSVLAVGAGAAVADDDHHRYNPRHACYDHEGFAGTFDSVGGPLGIVWSTAAGYDHEGCGNKGGSRH